MSFPEDNDPFLSLKSAPTPAPRDDARARALAAGAAAFAATQENSKKTEMPTQGNGWRQRLMSIISSFKRISIMDTRIPLGTAAIALLILPLGWQFYSSTSMTPADFARQINQPSVAETAPAAPVVVRAPEATALAAPQKQVDVAQQAVPAPPRAEMEIAMEAAPDMVMPAPQSMGAPSPSITSRMAQQSVQTMGINPNAGSAMMDASGVYLPPSQATEASGDSFTSFDEQRLKVAAEEPVSTFSIDVDTASYSYVRRMLEDGFVPEPDAVRIEELINYFPYDYKAAPSADVPFEPNVSVFPTPWNPKTQLIQIGIKGFELPIADTRSNLVFLIDTSGSMEAPDKLPLLKRAFGLLLDQLSDNDTVSIVTYAGSAGIALEPTAASEKAKILASLDQLYAGGSTAGVEGIELAYRLAEQAKIDGGTNRVILATDGDFNVGIDDPDALEDFIADKRKSGVSLSVLGFGRGNLDDATMQALAQNGNGNASYISSFAEARKVLVEEIGGTLHTIAKDVKIQIEFNPAVVSEYRLIGYETRVLNREDFNNDAVDAGDIGAGHTVTALYEITPVGVGLVEPLRYSNGSPAASGSSDEIAFLKMRYKLPDSDVSQLIETPITPEVVYGDIADAGVDAHFAAAVAAFGQKIKGSVYGTAMTWDEISDLARAGRGEDEGGYRADFVRLVKTASLLKPDTATDRCDTSASDADCQ